MVTMREVAQRAGVSQPTVSYVLNGKASGQTISEATRARVMEVAAELGYRRNELTRAAITGRSRVLGFIAPYPDAEHVARMVRGALEAADEAGYFVKVLCPRNPDAFDARLVERCIEMRLAGVIVAFSPEEVVSQIHDDLVRHDIPVALLDDSAMRPWGAPVRADYEGGMRLAIEHLSELGHRHIALLTGRASNAGAQLRAEAFHTAMRSHGLDAERIIFCDDSAVEPQLTAARELLAQSDRPSAIVTATDALALLSIRAALEDGLRVPADISIVGCGDLHMAEVCFPPLTTIQQPFYAMGRAVVRRLLAAIKQEREAPGTDVEFSLASTELVPARLVVRASTGPAPNFHKD